MQIVVWNIQRMSLKENYRRTIRRILEYSKLSIRAPEQVPTYRERHKSRHPAISERERTTICLYTLVERCLTWHWQLFLMLWRFWLARQLEPKTIVPFLWMLCWRNPFLTWCVGSRSVSRTPWAWSWWEEMWRVSTGMELLGPLALYHR